ncbi:hypothetical protein B0H11DRAFT_1754871 [Mycena galericulata]|nr:hypothetical protein B0H11DRAFT_1765680 [Mycena galericulata]KAJ7434278.1 hypothetical protein B0H11DRAFT_1757812 [Mycena galericulata]KAJ7436307.1 hypothetical protein B0H11DRAFT_1754871 [Mycena galericulata]
MPQSKRSRSHKRVTKQPRSGGAYKTLADDFDKEFLHKYGNDLDTSLIFAGLFSAVISAFITQIQPELQPDPNATTEALLLLLVKNVTGITPPAAQQAEPATIIVAAQGLLYLSLFCTLFSALLATLGKQWLLYYSSAGERGTIEDRGLHYAFASNTHLFRP